MIFINMSLKQTIRRILREELNSYVRRRVDISDEHIKKLIKKGILSHSNFLKQNDEVVIEFVSDFTTQELLQWFNQEEYDEYYDSVRDYIKENYSDFMLEYFHETFKENDDSTYCFIKHSERYGGRGFTECFGSWHSFLNRFGSWLPDVDWNKVQEKLKTENKILLARPLEGHIYEYFFSVLKK